MYLGRNIIAQAHINISEPSHTWPFKIYVEWNKKQFQDSGVGGEGSWLEKQTEGGEKVVLSVLLAQQRYPVNRPTCSG